MLSKFLLEEFRKRREDRLSFSVRSWAREMGVSHSTLNKWLNSGSEIDISISNLNALIEYFGQPVIDAIGIAKPPAKPKNPKA